MSILGLSRSFRSLQVALPIKARLFSSLASSLPGNLNLDPETLKTMLKPPTPPRQSIAPANQMSSATALPVTLKALSLLEKYNLMPENLALLPEPDSPTSITDLPLLAFHPSHPTPATATIPAPNFLLNPPPLRGDLLHRIFVHQRAVKRGRRKALTKTLSTKSGSNKKPHPQKGQGRARQGQKRRPGNAGGVKAHGPKGSIQDYGNRKMNRQVARLGVGNALAGRMREGKIVVVDSFWDTASEETPEGETKTKYVKEGVEACFGDIEKGTYAARDLAPLGGRTLFLMGDLACELSNIRKGVVIASSKNIPYVHVLSAKRGVNVADILKNDRIVVDRAGLVDLAERFE